MRGTVAVCLGLALGGFAAGPAARADPIVAAAGDIACDPADANYNGGLGTATACRMGHTASLISGWTGVSAVLVLGDNQYENGALAKYQLSYDASWGALRTLTRPVPGNHEYITANAAGYYAYFGSAAGDPAKGWYSYDLGTWHLIALNSNCAAVGGCGPGSPEEAWLEADLAANRGKCTLAYWHHPRFSSGPHGDDPSTDAFWRVLYRFGADVVLNGHDHIYERFHRQTPWAVQDVSSPRQFTVGSGGKNHTSVVNLHANSAVQNATDFGVLRLTLQPAAYAFEFINEAGTVLDSGSTACHLPAAERSLSFFAVAPCRLADTRQAAGPLGGPALAGGVPRFFPITGLCGVPASAIAVAVNATVTGASSAGSLRLYPAGDTVPSTNVVSFLAGQDRAGSAVIPIGQLGQLGVYAVLPSGTAGLVLDVSGYFSE